MGAFVRRKRSGATREIKVCRLKVEREQRKWPEGKQRKRRWTTLRKAKKFVRAPILRRIIEQA